MSDYILTVGLEIHAELETRTKMFCDSKNDPDEERPNVNICPVCMGYPGTLPVINREAVKSALRLGVALGGEVANYTEFDRKNYFYPDIPKGYQISQYKHPLVRGGSLLGVEITRVHLEEDTAKSIHNDKGDSLLDFNRAGVPLVELVTEPVIHDAVSAANFAKELQLLFRYLDIAEANMEKGEMRIEANVSVRKAKNDPQLVKSLAFDKLGVKVEVKNLNSFKSVEKAIEYEFKRQTELLDRGEKVLQETRGWNEKKEETYLQREKEESHDYRYFPDPDLSKLFISEIEGFDEKSLELGLPELPEEKRKRYKRDFGLKDEDIEIYVRDEKRGKYFGEIARLLQEKSLMILASNYIVNDLTQELDHRAFATLIKMLSKDEISSRGAKDIIKILEKDGGDPREIAEKNNLMQESDREVLKKVAKEILKEYPEAPVDFLVGQAMKKTSGRANPQILKDIFEEISE